MAIKPSNPYWTEILVSGTPLGIATNLPSTKKRAAPIPVATIVFTDNFSYISPFANSVQSSHVYIYHTLTVISNNVFTIICYKFDL